MNYQPPTIPVAKPVYVLWHVTRQISVKCLVISKKAAWGRIDLMVQPVAGTGTQWVSESSVKYLT